VNVGNATNEEDAMSIEANIVEHYGTSELLAAIEAGIHGLGKTRSTVTVEDLGPVDEFHVGGRAATTALCDRLGVGPDSEVLDIGCGIGGTARHLASTTGCRVVGVDLVPGYVAVARELTDWTGLADRISYEVGSALDLPVADSAVDVATLIHVGMNIEDKERLFSEAHRVLRPDGTLGVYDLMRVGDGDIGFPVPWASDPSTSFVADVDAYEAALTAAGFEILETRDRREFALEFFARLRERTAELGGPAPLGLHVIIGAVAPDKLGNLVEAITSGTLAPVEITCRAS